MILYTRDFELNEDGEKAPKPFEKTPENSINSN